MKKLFNNVLELKEKGLSHDKISEELNCSKSTVSVICNKYKKENNFLIKDLSDDLINSVIKMRKNALTYNEIINNINITEDQLKYICRAFNLNNSNFYRKPTDEEIKEMQNYYNNCNSLRKVEKKFGWSRFTISKYIIINKSKSINLSKEEYNIKRKQDKVRNVIKWRQDKKEKLVEYKGGCCQNCGYKKSIGALEFHHIDPKGKDFTISSKSYAYERLKKEVDKCVLVCSNCHIEIHEELRNNEYSEIVKKIIN